MNLDVVVNAITTCNGKVLLGKKKQDKDHPISGKWHLPGGHIDKGEEPEDAVKREMKEETGLEVNVHQLVDCTTGTWTKKDVPIRLIYHCETRSRKATAMDDLVNVKWISPENVGREAPFESEMIENRKKIKNFLHKLEKTPVL